MRDLYPLNYTSFRLSNPDPRLRNQHNSFTCPFGSGGHTIPPFGTRPAGVAARTGFGVTRMHGIILKGYMDFVRDRHERGTWSTVREAAGVDRSVYLPVKSYPDTDFTKLVDATVEHTDRDRDALLEEFGEYVAPTLLDNYGTVIKNDWTALDVIERAGERYAPENGTAVECDRDGDEVRVTYDSELGLCPLGKGIAKGVADRFDTDLDIGEEACQLDGGDQCELVVTRG